MTPIEKAIRDFCGQHADWWPSTTQVQEMLALAQPEPPVECMCGVCKLGIQRKPLTDEQIVEIYTKWEATKGTSWADLIRAIEAAHGIKE